jgi:flagellar protein FlbD
VILLTKLNGAPISVNSDMIEFIEETPDTVLTLANNDKVVVQDRMVDVIEKVIRYKRVIAGLIETEEQRALRKA